MSGPLPDVRFQTKFLSRNPLVRLANGRFHATLLALVDRCPGATLLDAGCGEGVSLLALARRTRWSAEGIDRDEASLAIAGRALGAEVPLRRGDVQDLPYADDAFDLVIGTEVLEHVADPDLALAEMARVARHRLVLSVPREPLWRALNVARGRYLRRLGDTDGHIHHWSSRGFVRFCRRRVHVLERRQPIPWTFLLCAPR